MCVQFVRTIHHTQRLAVSDIDTSEDRMDLSVRSIPCIRQSWPTYLRIFTTAMFGKAGKKYADKIAQHVSVFRLRGVFVLVLLAFIDFGSRRVSRLLSVFFFHHAIANNYCHRITVVRSFHCAAVNNYCHYYVTYLYVGGASSFEAYELQDAGINRAGH